MPRRSIFGEAKVRKVECRSKRQLDYAETERKNNLRRGPKPPPAEARHCGRAPQTSARSYDNNRSSRILGMTERNS